LAGKDLMFSVTVLSAREATAEEIANAMAGGAQEKSEGESCGTGCGCH